MKISIITVFPELYEPFLRTSLIARAQKNNIVEFNVVRFSDMCESAQPIDEPTCGHGAGMIVKPEVVRKAIEHCENKHGKGFKIFFSPQGKTLTQPLLRQLSGEFICTDLDSSNEVSVGMHLVLVCSRYEGMDDRVEKYYADLVLSIGDYVVMGGDAPALVFLEGLLRLVPSVVGRKESVEKESFTACFLDHPEYGLPVEWDSEKIPDIVLSGNHGAIDEWRRGQAAKKTVLQRFDWFRKSSPMADDITLAKKYIPNHYVALMHTDVLIRGRGKGNTSVASLDLHDICRSSATYGVKNVFMVTPLKDQLSIIDQFLDFWRSDEGKKYNINRFEAISRLLTMTSLAEAVERIELLEGRKPLIITTSAQEHDTHGRIIDYHSQGHVWAENRPVLFVFGTGQGLCDEIVEQSDFLLKPLVGMTDYRHLSVRAAVAIILDRWLGLN